MDNFNLKLTNPSTQQELLKLETMKARLEVFKEMYTAEPTSPVSYTWAMEYVMGFSKAEIKQILRQKKVEKKMFSEIETAPEEYMQTGLFADIDEKFKVAEDIPSGDAGDAGDAGVVDEPSVDEPSVDEPAADEPLEESVLFLEQDVKDLNIVTIDDKVNESKNVNILNKKNKSLNTKTKNLIDSITSKLNSIDEQTGLDGEGNDLLNEGNAIDSND